MTDANAEWAVADPFDLPEWLGDQQLRWATTRATESESAAVIDGVITGDAGDRMDLDLVCADVAYPAAVVSERLRHDAHQAWHFGQVLLLVRDRRHALAIPTTRWDADTVCEALRRFTKAVGVPPSQLSVLLRL